MKKVFSTLRFILRFEDFPATIVYYHPVRGSETNSDRIVLNIKEKPIRYDYREKMLKIHIPRVIGIPDKKLIQQGKKYRLRKYRWAPLQEVYVPTVKEIQEKKVSVLEIDLPQLIV